MPIINGKYYPVRAFPIAATAADRNILGRGSLIYGWSFLETTGAASALLQIIDGNDAGGTDAVDISLTPGQSRLDWLGDPGLWMDSGPFLNMISGTVQGTIYYLDVLLADLMADAANNQ